MNGIKRLTLTLGVVCLSLPVQSADFSDPTWPCIQRKVESLSLGIMWPHPVPESEAETEGKDLAIKLALRRVDQEQSEELIKTYVSGQTDVTTDQLGQIFRITFNRIGKDRSAIIDGIAKYAGKQTALSEQIDAIRVEMSTLMEAAEPDFDKVDALEEQLDWDERIYRDRAQSLVYVCETPVLLEKRAYAIAQMLLESLEK